MCPYIPTLLLGHRVSQAFPTPASWLKCPGLLGPSYCLENMTCLMPFCRIVSILSVVSF